MSEARHVTWENFKESFIQPGDPAAHIVPGSPESEIFVESDGARIGLRVPTADSQNLIQLPYQHIDLDLVHQKGQTFFQVSCDVQSLFEPFFAMLTSVVDLIQLHDYQPIAALEECAEKYFRVLSNYSILSSEKQVGLWCELWVLQKLLQFNDSSFVHAWIGPLKEPHDFRIGSIELEVKGTRSTKRSHIISNEVQLVPSDNSSLYLVSFQVEPGGGDEILNLPEMVSIVANALASSPSDAERFEYLLTEAGYVEAHASFYVESFKLRTRPTIVPITDSSPRITSAMLEAAMGQERSDRISDIKFSLDVSGMGFEESESEFQEVLRTS